MPLLTHTESEQQSIAAELARHGVMHALSDSHLTAISRVAKQLSFSSGQLIYEEGSDGRDFLIIVVGEMEGRRETPVGSLKVATLGVGEVVGEISLLDDKPRSCSVTATADGRMLLFGSDDVARLLSDDPEVELGFLGIFCRSLARKVRQANQVMTQIMAPGATSDRVATGSRGHRNPMDQASKLALLRDQGMSHADIAELSTFLEAESFLSGASIFVEGEPGDTLYIVAEGKVRISRHIPGMGEEALAILERGEVFGEMAWIDASPRSADAVAHTGGCTVLGISRTHLDGTLGQRSETRAQFLKLLCQVLCRRVRNMNDQLVAYRTMAFF